jgi:hypothetical protein
MDNYGGNLKFRRELPGQAGIKNYARRLEPPQQWIVDRIAAEHGTGGGWWDVFAWKGRKLLFAELKQIYAEGRGRDTIDRKQVDWLAAAIRAGVPRSAFLVVEWTLTPPKRAGERTSPQSAGVQRARPRARIEHGAPGAKAQIPTNKTLPPLPKSVAHLVGGLSPAQVFSILNPEMVSIERPSRLRVGIRVDGVLMMTPGEGEPGRSRRTPAGDSLARLLNKRLPAAYRWRNDQRLRK